MFSSLLKHPFFYRDFSYFCLEAYKGVCCKFVVSGKGLNPFFDFPSLCCRYLEDLSLWDYSFVYQQSGSHEVIIIITQSGLLSLLSDLCSLTISVGSYIYLGTLSFKKNNWMFGSYQIFDSHSRSEFCCLIIITCLTWKFTCYNIFIGGLFEHDWLKNNVISS